MADARQTEVLVVGAGPTGLTAAIELATREIAVRIVDKVPPRPPTESRALGTNARSQEIFERHGSLAPMVAQGLALHGFSFFARGKRVARLDLRRLEGSHPAMLHLRQAETEQVLIDRLAALGVVVERPLELTALRQDEARVGVTLTAVDGRTEELNVPYLVAADGARSSVRKALGVEFIGEASGIREYVADAKVEWRGASRDLVAEGHDALAFPGKRAPLVFAPLAGDRWRVLLFATDGDARFDDERPSLALLQQLVDEHPDVDARLYDLTWVSAFNQSARKTARQRHGRIFLVGDAAHVHSPFGGQGMNTGVSDAANLCWKLALRLRGFGNEALLDSYQDERNPILEQLLKVTQRGPSLFRDAARSVGQRPALWVATHAGPARTLVTRWLAGYTNHYRASPIVTDALASGARRTTWGPLRKLREIEGRLDLAPGDRAPDARGLVVDGQRRRLFELWAGDPRHQLLIVPADRTTPDRRAALRAIAQTVAERHGALVRPWVVEAGAGALQDADGELARRYAGPTERLYLIRPDGYIGFRGDPADAGALETYLTRVLGA